MSSLTFFFILIPILAINISLPPVPIALNSASGSDWAWVICFIFHCKCITVNIPCFSSYEELVYSNNSLISGVNFCLQYNKLNCYQWTYIYYALYIQLVNNIDFMIELMTNNLTLDISSSEFITNSEMCNHIYKDMIYLLTLSKSVSTHPIVFIY